ncbi:hypothetical protein CRUP_028427 [Coryphaenoides rupestris]|nr:hypothetical protein CRUP_028427 [Coryphaenoides rupestris]
MFSPQQMILPLSQLVNALHALKCSANSAVTASVQSLQRDLALENDLLLTEPSGSLRDVGLSEFRAGQLEELLSRLLPSLGSQDTPSCSSPWKTSHASATSFFHNKHAHVQSRGFKTLKSSTRRKDPAYRDPAETDSFTSAFMKRFLSRSKGVEPQVMEELMRQKNLPEAQQEAFKTGFAEGFMRSLAFEKSSDTVWPNRLLWMALLGLGVYNLYKNNFITAARFRAVSGLDANVDPVDVTSVTFDHVKGVEEAKNDLQEVVDFLKNPQKFTALGGKLPKGILLVGPPGTGKTLLARAVAGEADVPFYYAAGSEFDEMFVGVGASRIRSLFKEAKASAPSVIFIDELDSVGGKRVEFKPNEGVIVIGATNFAEALDSALVRPGRFDMQVTVPRPDVKGRTEILNWYLSKVKVDPAVEAEIIARGTVGFTGADLENLVNQAALKAAVDQRDKRRSVEIDQKNKEITAYHESGHAIVAYYTKDAMPINKATIMPRGPTLGHVSMLPEDDRWSETRAQLLAQMDVSMGGRVAEELIFGDQYITTAKLMVTRFGMSDKLGVMTYNDLSKQSPETQAAVEQEVRVLLKDSYERARTLLKTYSQEHEKLAGALLRHETLDAKEIRLVLEGRALDH